uniref:Uncharacterized protein n=1 Tax=Aegilops tauschii subsp. strangulata TaxID=200361 RepID=A0A453SUM7_AEGTS
RRQTWGMAAASSHLDLGGGTKRRRKEEEVEAGVEAAEDHISELPEALRLHVLCLLPLKSAIRTGALSTGWRSLWTRRWPAPSSLDFHLGTHDSPHPLLETLERRGRRRLQRFALSFDIGELQAEHFRRCLEYAAACAVEDLHVHLAHSVFNIFFNYRLPLGDPHLARLSLGAMTVGLPDSFSARSHPFSALEVIHLHCVRISDGTLRSLVAACPLLHTLDLRYCEGLYFISVAAAGARPRSLTVAQCGSDTEVFLADDASGLRSFHYSGAYMPAYRIPATTALADLYICFGGPERRGRRRNWLQLLTNLSNLTVLTLCSRVLRVRRSLHFMPSGLISILSYCLIDNFLRCYALQRLSAEARARLVATSAAPCKLLNLRELQLLMFALEIDNMNDIYCFLVTCCGPRLERLFVQLPTSSYQDK